MRLGSFLPPLGLQHDLVMFPDLDYDARRRLRDLSTDAWFAVRQVYMIRRYWV